MCVCVCVHTCLDAILVIFWLPYASFLAGFRQTGGWMTSHLAWFPDQSCRYKNGSERWIRASPLIIVCVCVSLTQLAKKIREKFNRYLDVVNRNKQVVEASYTAHLTSPLTAIQDCCSIPASMMEWVTPSLCYNALQEVHSLSVNPPPTVSTCTQRSIHCCMLQRHARKSLSLLCLNMFWSPLDYIT